MKPVRQRPDIYVDRESDKPIVVKKLANKMSKKEGKASMYGAEKFIETHGDIEIINYL